jgi:hypothetical protein
MTPGEPSYLIRVHKRCARRALEEGYTKPDKPTATPVDVPDLMRGNLKNEAIW